MNKIETISVINNIFEYIENSEVINNEIIYKGHPGLFFFHTKEEFNNYKEQLLNKDKYDKYDIYYISNALVKYMVGKFDQHTRIINNAEYIDSIILRKIDNSFMVVNTSKEYDYLYGYILDSINGIDIDTIGKELEPIISYPTIDYFNNICSKRLLNISCLKSLPIFNCNDSFTYTFINKNDKKDIVFKVNTYDNFSDDNNYIINDDICIINYKKCTGTEEVQKMVNELSKMKVSKFIVDLRGNTGGDSNVIKPLIKFLQDKKVVTLIDEEVFSSGIFAAVDLRSIGAYFIGNDISTSINHFGHCMGELVLDEFDLRVKVSRKYFDFKDNNFITYTRNDFNKTFSKSSIRLQYLKANKRIIPTKEDILNKEDPVMKSALEYLKNI